MHDDDLTPLHELASSHLDADTSPEERAQVAASSVLQSLVTSFEDVRARLADVPPAPAAARESALAAALAAFDEQQSDNAGADASVAPRPSAPVISLDSRRRWPQRVMGIAAAVAAVGVIGVGLTRMGGSDDKFSSDTAAKAEFDVEAAAENAPGDAPMSTIGTITGGQGASVALTITSPEELAALPLPASEMDVTVSAGGGPDSTEGSADTYSVADTVTSTARTESMPVSSLPAALCLTGDQVYLADIYFQGELAVAARDTVTGVTYAIADDCSVLASVGP